MQGTAAQFRFPQTSHRVAIYGRTGSGKTVGGTWLLSEAPFDRMPYIVLDFKRDDLLGKLERVKELALKDKVPKEPGLYVLRPIPNRDDDLVENFLWRVWQKRNTGLFVDEGYMVPKSGAFDAILTQGRSLRIPVINLTQRPVWLSRFVTSQADFQWLFHLNDDRDTETVRRFMPREIPQERLPEYHSHWYDVDKDTWFTLGPAPQPATLIERINERLTTRRRFI